MLTQNAQPPPESAAAHTPNDRGEWHSLEDHLRSTAELASGFAEKFGAGELGRLSGLLHDLGKADPAFQKYLREAYLAAKQGKRPAQTGPDHKVAGAWLCKAYFSADAPSFVILGHHGELPSRAEWQSALAVIIVPKAVKQLAMSLARGSCQSPGLERALSALCATPTELEMFLRMLFSCLVDADYLDTEAHFSPQDTSIRGPKADLRTMLRTLREDQDHLMEKAPVNRVNSIRREVYEQCLEAAQLPQGVFRLTVPTGGGKTRSSLAFALAHAVRHGLERVIYAIPYTSIIEQTADVFRGIFRDPFSVLEHHCLSREPGEVDGGSWFRLTAENWDAPLIVTTTVQLFESLFSNKPSRCRKVHRIARSVIILDEVQCLPVGLLQPILDVLRTMVEKYNVTVVLCTDTQPGLDVQSPYLKGFPNVTDIIGNPRRYFEELRRAEYRIEPSPLTWEQVADRMREHSHCLAVVNTRKDALNLLDALGDDSDFHLSTLLCGAHRRDVLREVKRRLENGERCRVVSTQVVEAGVDVDFPVVLRAIGPLDRIIQAAGRCNREGRLSSGVVYIFDPEEGCAPRGPYQTGMHEAAVLLREGINIHDPTDLERYFARLYQDVNTDAKRIQSLRESLDFPEVGRRFRMIEDDTVPVLVPYPDREGLFHEVVTAARESRMTRSLWRKAQSITVAVYRRDLDTYRHLVDELVPSQLYAWYGDYDPARGVGTFARDPSDLVV
ncbi:MAG: CRISPR-associated helicase Cas3' [Candidatus Methanomethyliaceae archaeon]